ncbi:MAG: hypothetical protein PHZ26_03330 [Candidatus Gracilibacteria bacterium]|nr:hypothetical protein [Candidatus Gracilibacteria bacterium]MDD2908759.1 hypothetical protein [Candidatus Gracilibacteria bacterium]
MNPEVIISELIDKTIKKCSKRQSVKLIFNKTGNDSIRDYYQNLKQELLKEISETTKNKRKKNISNTIDFKRLSEINILGTTFSLYYFENKLFGTNTKYQVNLVFPCRNSSSNIGNSFDYLLKEIKKSFGINFNIVFVVNNSTDDTRDMIHAMILNKKNKVDNANFYLIESPANIFLGLPNSLNCGYDFIKNCLLSNPGEYSEVFFSFWDDELEDFMNSDSSIFALNIGLLLSSENNKAISAYMIDKRNGISKWHDMCKGFSADVRFIRGKPYLHGGAGTVLRFKDYPNKLIHEKGIADTDLSAKLLSQIKKSVLRKIEYSNWPVRSNHNAPVHHPTETNILSWTIKYLMYFLSWEMTLNNLVNKDIDKNIMKLWDKQIKTSRINFHNETSDYLLNLSHEKILDTEFMREYYQLLYNLNDKETIYNNLKYIRNRSY